MDINRLIAQSSAGGRITLPTGEFEGPLIVTKPLYLIGSNTTIWAKSGAVIDVRAAGVTLENLRAEITEGSLESAAIIASAPTTVKNVEVLGNVRGFGAEDGHFDVPRTIELGAFKSNVENTFSLVVNVPVDTKIECALREVKISPNTLKAGRNELLITVSGISAQTLLYAEVLFISRFRRRIYLTGRPKSDAPKADNKRIYTASERTVESAVGVQSPTPPEPVSMPKTDVISLRQPQSVLEMSRGQRIPLDKYLGTKLKIRFTCEKPKGMEIDPYAFLLDEKEHSLGDEGLVFFGNESSPKGEVTYFPADGHIEIDIARIDYRVRKIALAYSIYAGSTNNCFSVVKNPRVAIFDDDTECVSFEMDGLTRESTVIALELYLYKGEWKISAVGAGYNDGMAKLCNRYGIEVES